MQGLLKPYRTKLFRTILGSIGLVLLTQSMMAQTFTQVDSATYKHYLEKEWDELIRTGKAGIRSEIDFYYLRMRIGIAYYEKNNYKSAQLHFRKAIEFNEGDPVASEYLYYSYLFAGQIQQAALMYKGFSPSLQEKIQAPGLRMVDRISAEYLYNHTFTDDLVNDPASFEGLPLGARIITRNYHNLNIGLTHNMHPGTSFTHAFTYLDKSNYYYYDDGSDRFGVDGQKVRQYQYYLSPSFTTRGGLIISPAFHFLHVGYKVPYLIAGGSGSTGGPGGGGTVGGGENVAYSDASVSQVLGGLKLVKHQGVFNFSLGGIYSNLNDKNQFTGSGSVTWYPRGNLDRYLGATLYVHMDDLNTISPELIPDVIFGYGVASKVWLEISGSYGKMKNFAESNGYIIYNGLDWMNYKLLGNILIPLGEKGSLIYAGARFAQYENSYISFTSTTPENQYLLTYNSVSIFGGLSWKF